MEAGLPRLEFFNWKIKNERFFGFSFNLSVRTFFYASVIV
jgi:hypothetical protein